MIDGFTVFLREIEICLGCLTRDATSDGDGCCDEKY